MNHTTSGNANTSPSGGQDSNSSSPGGLTGRSALGTTTNKPSPKTSRVSRPEPRSQSDGGEERRRASRSERFELRDALRDFTSQPRAEGCGCRRVVAGQEPQVAVSANGGKAVAHWTRVQLCGRIWICPVCSPRIRQVRAMELDAAARRWIDGSVGGIIPAHGTGSVALLTLTIPHTHDQTLAETWRTLRELWGALLSGKGWQTAKTNFGVEHYVRAYDLTHGANGWHPHIHALVFTRTRLTDKQVAAFATSLYERAHRHLDKRGIPGLSRLHGVVIERAKTRKDVTRYLCQVVSEDGNARGGWSLPEEALRTDLKTSRHAGQVSPWQMLGMASVRIEPGEGSAKREEKRERYRALWREYERGTKGARAVRWSAGFRAMNGLAEERDAESEAATNAEVVSVAVGGVVIYECGSPAADGSSEWRSICQTRGARSRILNVAERSPFPRIAVRSEVARVVVEYEWARFHHRAKKRRGSTSSQLFVRCKEILGRRTSLDVSRLLAAA
jgi:hypothetical protein